MLAFLASHLAFEVATGLRELRVPLLVAKGVFLF